MVNISIELSCNGCTRTQKVEETNVVVFPHLQTFIAAHGWSQFMGGPTLCDECVQNVETVRRVAQIFVGALNGIVAKKETEPAIERTIAEHQNGSEKKIGVTERRKLCTPKGVPREAILEAYRRHASPGRAAKEVGLSYHAYHQRLLRLQILGQLPKRGPAPVDTGLDNTHYPRAAPAQINGQEMGSDPGSGQAARAV